MHGAADRANEPHSDDARPAAQGPHPPLSAARRVRTRDRRIRRSRSAEQSGQASVKKRAISWATWSWGSSGGGSGAARSGRSRGSPRPASTSRRAPRTPAGRACGRRGSRRSCSRSARSPRRRCAGRARRHPLVTCTPPAFSWRRRGLRWRMSGRKPVAHTIASIRSREPSGHTTASRSRWSNIGRASSTPRSMAEAMRRVLGTPVPETMEGSACPVARGLVLLVDGRDGRLEVERALLQVLDGTPGRPVASSPRRPPARAGSRSRRCRRRPRARAGPRSRRRPGSWTVCTCRPTKSRMPG